MRYGFQDSIEVTILLNSMYIIYEDHIEKLEEENEDLKQEVLLLRQRLRYYSKVLTGTVINGREDETL